MLYTKYTAAQDAQSKLQKGINLLAEAVSVTLGPKGQLAVIRRLMQPPFSTKDGKTVAEEFCLDDMEMQVGVKLAYEAAKKTCDEAGDGTTATIILTNAIVNEGLKAIATGGNAVNIVNGIKQRLAFVVNHIKETATPIDLSDTDSKLLEQVATISVNGDEVLGAMIAEAYRKIGQDGICNMGEQLGDKTEVRYSKGLRIDSGYEHEGFVTNYNKMTAQLDSPYVLICENKITDPNSILLPPTSPTPQNQNGAPGAILQQVGKTKRSILLMCDGLDEVSKSSLIQMAKAKNLNICVAKLPGNDENRKEILKDIAALTGATIISTIGGIKIAQCKMEHLGSAVKVVVGRNFTIFEANEDCQSAIDQRAEELRQQLKDEDNTLNKAEVQTRLAKLTSGIATIHVGGATNTETTEIRYRVEDAILATKSAIEEGVVVGGGLCLANAAREAENAVLSTALLAPLQKIFKNAGGELNEAVQLTDNKNIGFNAATGQFEDLLAAGVIDAAKVVRCSIENATSVACQVLLTQTLLVQDSEEFHTQNPR